MSGIRLIAILVGGAIVFSLEYWVGLHRYISLPLGAIGYLVTRYVGWLMSEGRRANRLMGHVHKNIDQIVEKAKRGEPLD
jgi:Flp pilus assembly protein TadB